MKKSGFDKSKTNVAKSIKEFVNEKGWYVPSIHGKYVIKDKINNPSNWFPKRSAFFWMILSIEKIHLFDLNENK